MSRLFRLAAFSFLLLLLLPAAHVFGQSCGPWRWINPLPQGNTLQGVAAGGGHYVAVGRAGTIVVSTDGAAWSTRPSNLTHDLSDVVWNGSQFLAAGGAGTVLVSTDGGETWAFRLTGATENLVRAAWNGSRWVIAGDAGSILTSTDGIAWQTAAAFDGASWYDLAWNGNEFLAVGREGASASSPDGVRWKRVDAGTRDHLFAVAWGAGRWLAVGTGFPYTQAVYENASGGSWHAQRTRLTSALRRLTWTGSGLTTQGSGRPRGRLSPSFFQRGTASTSASSARSMPPRVTGAPASARLISTPHRVPISIRSLKSPRWPIRNTRSFSSPSPAPSDMLKRSRAIARTRSAPRPSGMTTAVTTGLYSSSRSH